MARVQKSGHVDVVVDAAPEVVWRVVSDVTRTGEWSHECREVRWLDGAVIPAHRDRTAGLTADLERIGSVANPAVGPAS
jgi:Polyketide cyclase / dehydrase and lipid transport